MAIAVHRVYLPEATSGDLLRQEALRYEGERRGFEAVEDVEDGRERVLWLSGPIDEVVALWRWAFDSGTFVGSVEVDSEEDRRILGEELGGRVEVYYPMGG